MAEVSTGYAVKKPYLTLSVPAVTSQNGERISRLCDIRSNAALTASQSTRILESMPSLPLLDHVGVPVMTGGRNSHGRRIAAAPPPIACAARRQCAYPRAWSPGRNRRAASTPSAMNASSTIPCVIANGGSDAVGARSCRNGTFRNPCATRTNTLR